MAISNYLNDLEWNACFYVNSTDCIRTRSNQNFGDSIKKTVDKLLEKGYAFEGIDSHGKAKKQIGSKNAEKIGIWMGNPHKCDTKKILHTGREFLKIHCPELVCETDAEFKKLLDNGRLG